MKTLQELCLEKIVQDFDRHILAYSTSTKLKSSYEVLRRIYSFKIIQKLQENYEVRAEYIDFLINKYLKTLDTDWFDNCPWDAIEKKFAEIGPNLETLHMNEDDDNKDMHWENIFRHLPNLKVVDFHSCNDDYLDRISKFCPKIESISFGESNISHKGFQYLCGNEEGVCPCPQLKEIKLNDFEYVEVEDIKHLIKKLPLLEKINYHSLAEILYSIHKDDLNNLGNVKPYNLIYLDMGCMGVHESFDDALKICLSLCPNLKTLSCPVLKQEHLNLCSELSALQDLSLFNNQDSPVELNDFLKAKGSKLMSLKVTNFSFSVACLAQSCPRLVTLQLNNVTYQTHAETIPMLYNLKSISFENVALVDAVTEKAIGSLLISSPNLEVLAFKNCQVFSSDIKTSILKHCECGTIRHISFSYSTVESKFVHDVLLTCSTLRTLNLECSTLGADMEEMEELEAIASTLPNKPEILYYDVRSYSEDDDFLLNGDYDDFLDSDEDSYYDNYVYGYDYDYDDVDVDDFMTYGDY